MTILVETRGVELDMSLIEGRLQSFTPQTRQDAVRACQAAFARTCAAARYIDPGTTWRFWTYQNYFTIEVEAFHDAVVIHNVEITRPRDYDLGAFVIWYDNSLDFYRIPTGDGPRNHLADVRAREAATEATRVQLLPSLHPPAVNRQSTDRERATDRLAGSHQSWLHAFDTLAAKDAGGRTRGHGAGPANFAHLTSFHITRQQGSAARRRVHTCRDRVSGNPDDAVITEAEICAVIAALLIGTATRRIADRDARQPLLDHGMSSLMQSTRRKSSDATQPPIHGSPTLT